MSVRIWLRAEMKPAERRTALTPEGAAELVGAGFDVTVELSQQSVFAAEDYAAAGCQLVAAGTWPDAPEDAFILGLKELPEGDAPLRHRHIHFAHVFKQQAGWRDVLRRFAQGGGVLYDLEFLVDDTGRRVAAFGYWAGFAGAAVALKAWCGQQTGSEPVVPPLGDYDNRDVLTAEVAKELGEAARIAGRAPRTIVIGARGRSGSGAVELVRSAGLDVTEWDLEETAKGGPFPEILEHDIFVNCVLVFSAVPPFITPELAGQAGRTLSVVSDVSCDPYGDYNPVPLYSDVTSFEAPTLHLLDGPPPLDLAAIDNLPSMLPREASEDFGRQLLPTLKALDRPDEGAWARAYETFKDKTAGL
ncbi:MAG: saccharopine dehydrogenase [Hyphomicrobiales bacterium]